MKIDSKTSEKDYLLSSAKAMVSVARTAPKTKGIDRIDTLILTGDDIKLVSDELKAIGEKEDLAFFLRDSNSVLNADALVIIYTRPECYGIGKVCSYCGSPCGKDNCIFGPLDLGIALGSAVSIAADRRIDNRIMFSAGRAAKNLFLEEDTIAIAVALSCKGKNIFFDR